MDTFFNQRERQISEGRTRIMKDIEVILDTGDTPNRHIPLNLDMESVLGFVKIIVRDTPDIDIHDGPHFAEEKLTDTVPNDAIKVTHDGGEIYLWVERLFNSWQLKYMHTKK